MAFWGVEIKPGKPYVHQYDDEKGRLHISKATLGTVSSKEKAILVCNVGLKKAIYLCTMLPGKMENCQLNVEFEEYEVVTFSVEGPHSIHLSGFFHGESADYDQDYGSESGDSSEDGSFDGYTESEEYSESDSEDEEDDFMVDDMFTASPVANSGVRIEEIVDEDQPAREDGSSGADKQIVVREVIGTDPLESEDEDGFPLSSPASGGGGKSQEQNEESSGKGTSGQVKRKKAKDDVGVSKSAKRRKDGDDQPRDASQPTESSDAVAPETNDKIAKKKKNKKKKKRAREQEEKIQEVGESSKSAVQPEETNDLKPTRENEKNEKNKKKNKQQENSAGSNNDKKNLDKKGNTSGTSEKAGAKPNPVRTSPNGLTIEDVSKGKPNGKLASAGKKVSVRYTGKLQKNGKIFDSNVGRAPFKFHLGRGQVIKGWDIGVNGMRVGDKRRLTIPPGLGYGAKGAGKAIPPNATLVFDVELLDVN